jgi:hypothetical protein
MNCNLNNTIPTSARTTLIKALASDVLTFAHGPEQQPRVLPCEPAIRAAGSIPVWPKIQALRSAGSRSARSITGQSYSGVGDSPVPQGIPNAAYQKLTAGLRVRETSVEICSRSTTTPQVAWSNSMAGSKKVLSSNDLDRLAQFLLHNKMGCLECAMEDIGLDPKEYDLQKVVVGLDRKNIGFCNCCESWGLMANDDEDRDLHMRKKRA